MHRVHSSPAGAAKKKKKKKVPGYQISTFELHQLKVPLGWIDYAPILNHQSLSFITSALVSNCPSPIISRRISGFSDRWTILMWFSFSTRVDLGAHIPYVWRLNAPPGFKELVWKHMFDSLPIGLSRCASLQLGLVYCPCDNGAPLDLYHMFHGCSHFPVSSLFDNVLCPTVIACAPQHASHPSVDPHRWHNRWWFPVLCLKRLALCGSSKSEYSSLCRTIRKREWIISSFFWVLWRHRMRQAHKPDYFFSTDLISSEMHSLFSSDPLNVPSGLGAAAKKKRKKKNKAPISVRR